nr:hypothetical protein [uncultured Draconibacterium sp.]
MDNLTLETYIWLTELEEPKAAEIISECVLENQYYNTYFAMAGEEVWDSYILQIKVPGKYFKLIKKGELDEEKKSIEDALNDIAEKDHVHIQSINWTLRISGDEISSINDNVENELIKELNILKSSLEENIKTNITSGIDEYKKQNYVNSVRLIYPTIENISNLILSAKGENPTDRSKYKGLQDKIIKLKNLNCIENDLVEAITINKPRNSVLHGQFNPSLNRLVHPLCISSMTYLNEIIKAHNNVYSA